jgi:hypothetical protein
VQGLIDEFSMRFISKRNDNRKPRRRWWRFFTQFSLRSLLILVTAAACACWWWLQPGSREELIGGGLKLRRQVRIVGAQPTLKNVSGQPLAIEPTGSEPILVNAGSWRLADEHDDLIAAGRYERDAAEGHWVLYHANGRKAAAGRMLDGRRTGVWRTWDADGRRVSEVTYRVSRPDQPRAALTFVPGAAISSPASSSPLLAFGGCCCCSGWPPDWPPAREPPPEAGLRHGPARGWQPSGELRFEGAYQDDLRSGPWTTYDERPPARRVRRQSAARRVEVVRPGNRQHAHRELRRWPHDGRARARHCPVARRS